MVEKVLRFEAEEERRVAMLLEYDGRGERGLHAMGRLVLHDATKTAQGGPVRPGLLVVRQFIEEVLNLRRSSEAVDE